MPKILNTRLCQSKDTITNWETVNPVLLNGERVFVVFEDGEIKEKIGDGIKHFNDLPYFSINNNPTNNIPLALG